MRRRQPPTRWLMTDERMGDALWTALARLPRGGGVVFRHHATPPADRRALFGRVRAICRRRGLVLVLAGREHWRGVDGVHGRRSRSRGQLVTWPAHDRREAVTAVRAGAVLVFVSPVFATRSHPGAPARGPLRAGLVARGLPVVRIALGGMTAARYAQVAPHDFAGWAAIDAWAG